MDEWFTVETIDDDTFAISEYRHWEETHSYLLWGGARALLIDTGLGIADIRQVTDELSPLPVTVANTHAHWDHIGGNRRFDEIFVHEAEAAWLGGHFPLPLQAVKQNLLAKPCSFPPDFSVDEYTVFSGCPKLLRDGDVIDLGGRKIKVIHTPGHSPGHCCFLDTERGYLFSGDLIYKGCLDMYYPTTDRYAFWESIRHIARTAVKRILPAHHDLHIPVGMAAEIDRAFGELEKNGTLRDGSGIFDFGAFQLHI